MRIWVAPNSTTSPPHNSRKSRTAREAKVPRVARRPALQMRVATCTPWSRDPSRGAAQRRVPNQRVEVGVVVQDRRVDADRDRCDEAIDEPANGLTLTPTAAKQRGGIIVVRRCRRNHHRTREQSAQPFQVVLVARAGKHFHPHRMASRQLGVKQGLDPIADRRSGTAQKLDPRRSVDQNHRMRLERSSSRSPCQPEPRNRRASSTLRGSAASVRSAKFTASRLVARRYRRITSAQASSSTSMLVRDIHQPYTAIRADHNRATW